ncbi:hypothetical protein CLOM_g2087 [Closterium sp. NIES-68]|nr:hypothetical protein CLOM_g2087 [Closterium sp. NIES-68]
MTAGERGKDRRVAPQVVSELSLPQASRTRASLELAGSGGAASLIRHRGLGCSFVDRRAEVSANRGIRVAHTIRRAGPRCLASRVIPTGAEGEGADGAHASLSGLLSVPG